MSPVLILRTNILSTVSLKSNIEQILKKRGRAYNSSPKSQTLGTRFLKIHDQPFLYSLYYATQGSKIQKEEIHVFFPTEAIAMDMDPFLHCVIPNFIQSQNFLEGLQKELLNLDFHEKYNDLYKFQQVFMPLSIRSFPSEI